MTFLSFPITSFKTHVIVKALFIFPIMVLRHLQRLHKGKYIDTLIFDIFKTSRRWYLLQYSSTMEKYCFHLKRRDLERFFQIHVSKLKSFVDLFTRTLVRGTQWQDRSLPLQPFPYKPPENISPGLGNLNSQIFPKISKIFLPNFYYICLTSLNFPHVIRLFSHRVFLHYSQLYCCSQVFKGFLQHRIWSWN